MILSTTRTELAEARDHLPGRVAVVMTMGALHEGHVSLLRTARAAADSVIMTLFVNPLQFGPNEDFDRYPRTRDDDLAAAKEAGVDVVFAPSRAEMYPAGSRPSGSTPARSARCWRAPAGPGFSTACSLWCSSCCT
jgi:pantoate--beta-alanine ligase